MENLELIGYNLQRRNHTYAVLVDDTGLALAIYRSEIYCKICRKSERHFSRIDHPFQLHSLDTRIICLSYIRLRDITEIETILTNFLNTIQ